VETFSVDGLGRKEAAGIMRMYGKKGWAAHGTSSPPFSSPPSSYSISFLSHDVEEADAVGDEMYLTSLISSGGNALQFGRGLRTSLSALV
jgi:small subunit ribosomal protein S29